MVKRSRSARVEQQSQLESRWQLVLQLHLA
jgi:hypothetical protein